MLVAVGVVLHIILLHGSGSNNPLGISSSDKIPFHSYFTIKDIVGFIVLFVSLLSLVLFNPNAMGEPDNYVMANPMATPPHIIPEWYFLFAYAILRTVPSKLGGVIGLLSSIIILAFSPLMRSTFKRTSHYPLGKLLYWSFVLSFVLLTAGGAWPVEEPFTSISFVMTCTYFTSLILIPLGRQLSDSIVIRQF